MTDLRVLLSLVAKDLRLVLRDRIAFFFTFFFPIVFAMLFGFIFSGTAGEAAGVRIVVVDEAGTEASARFGELVRGHDALSFVAPPDGDPWDRDSAFGAVRSGRANAAVVLEEGFGDLESLMFEGEPLNVTGAIDPSRTFARGVVEGVLRELMFRQLGEAFTDADRLRAIADSLETRLSDTEMGPIERALVERFVRTGADLIDAGGAGSGSEVGGLAGAVSLDLSPVQRDRSSQPSAFALTFAQGGAWGLMGCVMGFGLSIVRERAVGTMVRLRLAPISAAQVLGAKALACFLTSVAMMSLLVLIAHLPPMNVRAASYPLLVLAVASSAFGFVGVMCLLGTLGRTEGSIDGLSRAVLLVLALFGGAGVPLEFMPAWMVGAAGLSPFKWMIQCMDGALWRGLGIEAFVLPVGVLCGFGVFGFLGGWWSLARAPVSHD